MIESEVSIRKSLLDTLSFLASEAEQREFAAKVPYRSYQDEFACWWFDTFCPEESSVRRMFSESQIALLRDFSNVFEINLKMLGEDLTMEQLQLRPSWQAILAKASQTLVQFQNAP